jgi:predicted esterase
MCHQTNCQHTQENMTAEEHTYFLGHGVTPEEEDANRRFLRSQLEYDV